MGLYTYEENIIREFKQIPTKLKDTVEKVTNYEIKIAIWKDERWEHLDSSKSLIEILQIMGLLQLKG